ncbi:hypothetical protein NI389_09080 [Pseudoalteromonas xiamenensis]|uniref:hypothetical protein n=1 Tax=Pseudoalteromonas xiamenensis TaxID=882626 RepID=UPI0027E59A91|nr:hypothetical protein [Pseudoalteromonas xiamenensis]WMN58425.1 hypothetical protein NI389_09080 [Pseudoalteromonas xiamenensis]
MGIRSTLKKELMNLDAQGLMTADDVRDFLKRRLQPKSQDDFTQISLIGRFNEHHSLVQAGLPSRERELAFERHRLFKEILYPKKAVESWLSRV